MTNAPGVSKEILGAFFVQFAMPQIFAIQVMAKI